MATKIKKSRVKKSFVPTKEKLLAAIKNTPAEGLERMLDTPLYTYRVLKYLYEIEVLSPAGFLNNDDVYKLSLGIIGGKGEFLIRTGILDLYTRFGLANGFAMQGDAMTAFFIDNNDSFYKYLADNMREDTDDVAQEEYTMEFNSAYNKINTILLNQQVNSFLEKDEKLIEYLAYLDNKKPN